MRVNLGVLVFVRMTGVSALYVLAADISACVVKTQLILWIGAMLTLVRWAMTLTNLTLPSIIQFTYILINSFFSFIGLARADSNSLWKIHPHLSYITSAWICISTECTFFPIESGVDCSKPVIVDTTVGDWRKQMRLCVRAYGDISDMQAVVWEKFHISVQ